MSQNEIQKLYAEHKRIAINPLPYNSWLENYFYNKKHAEEMKKSKLNEPIEIY